MGKMRAHRQDGTPYLVDLVLTPEEVAALERAWRDSVLAQAVWLRDRHRDQLEIGGSTTLTAEQFQELLVYMQALRDWPQSPDFPLTEHRPVAPPWIVEQHQ
ncbi:phage tail assembly chaperone [Pseudomonas defluvii]|uniref:phage tail assembly chaperone n=1 Tax=Pseudomonas defluvii TaxID=1876757 RepID=UPI001FE1B95F|nr:phage tail assembly chaperone [Pseudomonas defluvii]